MTRLGREVERRGALHAICAEELLYVLFQWFDRQGPDAMQHVWLIAKLMSVAKRLSEQYWVEDYQMLVNFLRIIGTTWRWMYGHQKPAFHMGYFLTTREVFMRFRSFRILEFWDYRYLIGYDSINILCVTEESLKNSSSKQCTLNPGNKYYSVCSPHAFRALEKSLKSTIFLTYLSQRPEIFLKELKSFKKSYSEIQICGSGWI